MLASHDFHISLPRFKVQGSSDADARKEETNGYRSALSLEKMLNECLSLIGPRLPILRQIAPWLV